MFNKPVHSFLPLQDSLNQLKLDLATALCSLGVRGDLPEKLIQPDLQVVHTRLSPPAHSNWLQSLLLCYRRLHISLQSFIFTQVLYSQLNTKHLTCWYHLEHKLSSTIEFILFPTNWFFLITIYWPLDSLVTSRNSDSLMTLLFLSRPKLTAPFCESPVCRFSLICFFPFLPF